jgi:eukaryotic-like serine/threonine-protein kinase
MSPETGRKFGPYEIQSRLAGGGMGHVYRAWDERLHREVAIKLLNHEYAMPGMRERFLREARAASALNHPNICTIFDIGEQDGDPYLVMELLQGETLKDRILNRTMQVDEIVAVARETAEALGAAHAKGVVHRDIKPANIFLVDKPNGGVQAKVLDFGLAKIEGGVLGSRGRSLDLTTAGATVGTLAYMSPEQARGEVLDSRSDLFSLGVVIYEMATRQVPFQGATSALVFVQLLNHAPEPVREWNESVPRELEKIIFKLLAKERTARFQTARELELALLALTEKGSGGGWLRKAVATAVPLVRAPDPVAREKRLARSKHSSSGSNLVPARPFTPVPGDSPRPTGDQLLRPVARVPRGDTTPNPGRSTPVPGTGVPSIFSPVHRSSAPRRAGDPPAPPVLPEVVTELPPPTEPFDHHALPESPQTSSPPSSRSSGNREARPEPVSMPQDSTESVLRDDVPWDTGEDAEDNFPPLLEPGKPSRSRIPFRPVWLGIGAMLVIVVAIVVFLVLNRGHFGPTLLTRNDAVVVTDIENRSGDKTLDNSVAEGLRIDLAQSPWLLLRGGDSYRATRRLILAAAPAAAENNGILIARQTAERLGAKAYLYGTITGTGAPYLLHVDLRDVRSNDILTSAEARAESLQQIPNAIDQVAGDLRLLVGEPRASIDDAGTPLDREGTANLAALQFFSHAQVLISTHEPVAAVADLQQAVALDPRFIQAHLQLAGLYRQLRAETSASDSARLALAAADGASQRTRTLTQATYEIETSGDFLRASALLRQLLSTYPRDSVARAALAETLCLEGHMAEALQEAQQAYADDPFNAAAYLHAERALIGLDRYDAAFQLDAQVQRLGLATSGESFQAAYLDGRQYIVDDLAAKVPVGKIEYRPDWSYGLYLDNGGRLGAGATLWTSRAAAAQQNDSLKSAAAFLLAQGAVDRALLGDCSAALALARDADAPGLPQGRIALFNLGMSHALCGDTPRANQILIQLQQKYPQSFDVNAFYLPDMHAAIALHDHDPASALDLLQPARPYDLISLTPFLRGRAHVDLHQDDIGIIDFQTILAHRGVTYVVGNAVYPAAELGVARAFADTGDQGNSAQAYRKFIEIWRTADPLSPLLVEARLHSAA